MNGNEYYSIEVDRAKQRVYFTMKGAWKEEPDKDTYRRDWKNALQQVSEGFTVLTDLREFTFMSQDWPPVHVEAQGWCNEAGLAGTAELLTQDALVKMQVNRLAKESGMKKRMFANQQEAEAWLDTLSA